VSTPAEPTDTPLEPTVSPVVIPDIPEDAGTTAPKPTGRRPNPRIAQWKRTWYFLRRNTLAMIGLGMIVFLVALAIYALTFPAPYNQLTQYCSTNGIYDPSSGCICTYSSGSVPPGPNCYQTAVDVPSEIPPTLHLNTLQGGPLPLGSLTVNPGTVYFYNLYDGIVRGSDWSLTISFSIVASGALIGLIVGAVAGFSGGVVDETLMRLVDIFLSIPQLLFIIVTVAALSNLSVFSTFGSGIILLIMVFVIIWWPFYARIVRGQVLVVREQKYVEAARASGAGRGRIIAKHIIPNSVYPVFVQMSLDVGSIPLLIGALVFLGFHLFPTPYFPEWGSLSALSVVQLPQFLFTCQSVTGCAIPWWQITFPGLFLFIFAISVNFFSDGLRDALDPRLRR
jgi:peptide/nickel transport system permease protein